MRNILVGAALRRFSTQHAGVRAPRWLPAEPEAEPECPLVDAFPARVGDTQCLHERSAADAVGRVGMVRRIRKVECLGAKLQMEAFGERKVAVETEVGIDEPRAPQAVRATGSETPGRRSGERR